MSTFKDGQLLSRIIDTGELGVGRTIDGIDISVHANATDLITAHGTAGKVGVGTASPAAQVHLYKAAVSQSPTPLEMLRLEIEDTGVDMSAGHGPGITFFVGETSGSDWGGTVAVVRESESDVDSASAMVFHTAIDDTYPAERMRITSTGSVGVGTDTPVTKLTLEGAMTLKEQAAADADTAGYGQVWCKTASPAELWFTSDAGDDIQLTSGTGTAGSGTITALNNQAANRIVTIGSTTTELDGEANLTYDGTDLACTLDTATFTSTNSTDPLVIIKNTTNDANGARLRFLKDKGAAGADADVLGIIEFYGDDAGQNATAFASIKASISEADETDEAGKLEFFVAESDGTTTTLTAGLVLEGEHATDGEVDVTIGAGANSLTTIAGDLDIPNGGFALGSDASGDMYYRNASGVFTRIGIGSDNHVLTLDGAVPGWEAAAGGGDTTELHVQTDSVSDVSAPASVDADAAVVMCVSASGARYIQLPAVATDRRLFIKDKSGNAATHNISILTNASEEIDGSSANLVISTNYASVQIVSDGTKWYII